MTGKEATIKSKLDPVSEESLALYRSRRGDIVVEATRQALTFEKEVSQHGGDAEKLIAAGLDFTTQAIETAMQFSDVAVLAHQISWAMDRLPHDSVEPAHVLHRLEILTDVISTLLPAPHAQAVNQYLHWMVAEQKKRMAQDE